MNNIFYNFQIVFIAFIFVFLSFMWQGNTGFSLWDEGYLWYGAQRVMVGEVPIRDFMAYDPGRYYWSAGLMRLWGDNGIMSLRWAVAIIQALGLFVALFFIDRHQKEKSLFYLFVSAAILMAWMFPRHKLFDISMSIFLVGALAFLCEKPTRMRYFFTGLCVGGVAVFGRNHGVYGVFGSIFVIIFLNIKKIDFHELIRMFLLWIIGVVLGFSPIIYMIVFIPDFFYKFWESIAFLFEIKKTNLSLPIPWPWLVDFSSVPFGDAIRNILIGGFFLGLVAFGILSVGGVIWKKIRGEYISPLLISASFLTLPYAHFAYSRPDIGHLALGIFPCLIGFLALFSVLKRRAKWFLALILCVVSLGVMHTFHPGWQCTVRNQCVDIEISHNNLRVDPQVANEVTLLRQMVKEHAPDGRNFVVVPFPGAYPLFERKSPMWTSFVLWPRSIVFQKEEIERIKNEKPGFAFIFDWPLDNREDLRFRNTNPLIYQYILDNFEFVPNSVDPAYQIYKARD